MGTSIPIHEAVKNRLETDYRHDSHETWNDTLTEMMDALPTIDRMNDTFGDDVGPTFEGSWIETNGAVDWVSLESTVGGDTVNTAEVYPSRQALADVQETVEHHVPEHPDAAYIGGDTKPQTEIARSRLELDGRNWYLDIDIPPALFGGQDGGEPTAYDGEPVFIENNGEIVQSGRIDSAFTTATGLTLALTMTMPEELRERCHPHQDGGE